METKKPSVVLVQFAKWPIKGRVKTRLAKSAGEAKALSVHIELTEYVAHQLVDSKLGDVQLWLDRQGDLQAAGLGGIERLVADKSVRCHTQDGKDLGERMAHALRVGLQRFSRVVIVGSDCPAITSGYLNEAIDRLDRHDVVLGPAEDGGYVLIGCSRWQEGLLDDIEWGQESVLRQTLSNAESLKLDVSLLPVSWDVDTVEDYQRWQLLSGD